MNDAKRKVAELNGAELNGAESNRAELNQVAMNPAPHEHVIFTDLDGVEGVLVDLETKQYYQLNETASAVWRGLTTGQTAPEVAEHLTTIYDVTPTQARASVDAILLEFHARRLLK
jgi:hypothetical protein